MIQESENNRIPRPPVVVVLGHIDHGKSTLLDTIRKSNVAENEAGGITQEIGAYEVTHTASSGKTHPIVFLDTPGHAAFQAMREKGARVADIGVLVVAADDGVKPQTKEALSAIISAKIPYIAVLNKIDKLGINIERARQSLLENEIYIEGYGGSIPCVLISAKTGEGVAELLDMIVLIAELENFTGDMSVPAEGIVIETKVDKKRGLSATLLIKNGSLVPGKYIVAGDAVSPGRIIENFLGKPVKEAHFSSPVRVTGWSSLPQVGLPFETFSLKKEAEEKALENAEAARDHNSASKEKSATVPPERIMIPLVVKVHVSGLLEAIKHELAKIETDQVGFKIVSEGIGTITERDVKTATGKKDTVIIGFSTGIDAPAKSLAERLAVPIEMFDIIYKLSEWFVAQVERHTPKIAVEEVLGKAKILRLFSHTKDKQIVGGRVVSGVIKTGAQVKIFRRDAEIGSGRIRELQREKNRTDEVSEGREFGTMIEAKIEIAEHDTIEAFTIKEQV